MLDSSLINKNYPAVVFPVTKREIKSFSEATGQTDPLYYNENISKKKKASFPPGPTNIFNCY